jgi:archaellum biogenesis ATPase FlaH
MLARMSMNIAAIIKSNQIIVFVVSPKDFSKRLQDITKTLAGQKKAICYVSLNKPYETIREALEKAGVPLERVYFVDAVSSRAGSVKPDKAVLMVSSPSALTELSIAISKGVELWKADAVLFDSLSTLLVYEGASSVLRFVHSVTNSLRVKGLSCVFTILKPDLKDEIAKDIGMFADRIEELY